MSNEPIPGAVPAWDFVTRLSPHQKIAVAGILCLAFLAIYVPWTYTLNANGVNAEKAAGYHFIFNPPEAEHKSPAFGVKVDVSRVLIPMAVVVSAMIASGLLMAGKHGRPH